MKERLARQTNKAIIDSLESARIEYENMQRLVILSGYTFPSKPSKDGIYRIYVQDSAKQGGRKQLSSSTLEGLKDKVYTYERSSKYSQCKKTIGDIFQITQDEKLKYIKSEEKKVSVKNTIVRNKAAYKRFVTDTFFDKMFICDVTKNDIEELFFINLERYELKKKGLASLKAVIKPIFDLAFQEYWISDNPYARVDFKKFNNMLIEDTPIEDRFFSQEELDMMLQYVHKKQRENHKNFFTPYALELQMIAALRRGEVPPLKWTDIDDFSLTVQREMITAKSPEGGKQEFKIVEHTKNLQKQKISHYKGIKRVFRQT